MFIPVILSLVSALVPTGVNNLSRHSADVSPLQHHSASFTEAVTGTSFCSDGNTVMIIVAHGVNAVLSSQIAQLSSDIQADGWNTSIQVMAGGTATDIRALLQSEPDLDGAVLIGFLPCAWYEEDYWAVEEFPCELYLMDLDGVWGDADADGLFDSHTGDVAPEIWIGRIDAHAAEFGSEILMLSEYLEKNHLYRTGSMTPPSRALTFIDDDWSGYSSCGLNSIYGASNVTVVNSPTETTAANYLSRLAEGYEFVHLMAHSCPWGHTFKTPSGMAGTVMAPEIAQVNPNTAFLQLFSCSNARWVESGCLGNWYLFGTDTGLLISGAAKTGSMLDFEEFYNPVGSGSCFGEAFRDWWAYEASGGFSSYEKAWFYGNALLGDPTLKPRSALAVNSGVHRVSESTDGFAVSTSSYSDCFPDAASYGDITAVAWLTGENGRLDIAARFHDDSSDSWSQVYIVDADEYWDSNVSVCFDNSGEPWLAWSDFEYATYSYRIKTAHGMPFENVTTSAPQEGYQVSPDLACTDRMWLVWQDWESTGGRIMVKALEGSSFSGQLSSPGEWSTSPAASPGPQGDLHAVWVKNTTAGSSIMWSAGDENGFSAPVEISSGVFCHSPHIALVGEDLTAIWQSDGTTSSITARRWDGSQWLSEQSITSVSDYHLVSPVICESPAGETMVCWQQGRTDGTAWASVLTGNSWSDPVVAVSSSGPVWNPLSAGGRMLWAGTEGTDWNIYCESSEGIQDEQIMNRTELGILSNPVQNTLSLSVLTGNYGFTGRISVYDISGRTVLQRDASIQPEETYCIDCSSLPNGVYSVVSSMESKPLRFTLLR